MIKRPLMDQAQQWSEWLLPEGGFEFQDIWQLFLLVAILLVSSRLFRTEKEAAGETNYNPKVWLDRNRSFLAFWTATAIAFLITRFAIGNDANVLRLFFYLGGAWVLIGISTSLLREKFWAESVALVGYLVTGLYGLSLVDGSIRLLEQLSFSIGDFSISAWGILAGILALVMTLWISLAISRIVEVRIEKVPRLSASLKVLIAKIVRIVSIVVAIMISVSSMGVDLSALTVLGGAIGLGLGFGLQKVVSNFISGIILLTDNSIKPGDVIEIDETYGWINNLRARYASVITRDGTEHLIPNEDLITQRVINWSYTNNLVRLKIPVGVSYNADPHQCIELVKEAAQSIERVLKDPPPVCLLKGFGDSSVDLELRIWIKDPSNGVSNVKSQVLLKIWDSLKANDIEIPFPQRDLHIRSGEVVTKTSPDGSA